MAISELGYQFVLFLSSFSFGRVLLPYSVVLLCLSVFQGHHVRSAIDTVSLFYFVMDS